MIQIQKFQKGSVKGGLINHEYSGTWGNRGQGNELQSALENGLSWTWDKISNAGDYIEQGLGWVIGLIPGGMSQEEYVQDIKNKQLARNSGEIGYVNHSGKYKLFPTTGIPPKLPGLPKNPSNEILDVYNRLKKLRSSWTVRESQLNKVGQLDKMPNTLTAKRYRELEKLYNQEIQKLNKKPVDKIKLTKRQTSSFKAEKARATDDLRAANQGRPAVRERQYDEIERMMRKDPKAAGALHKYDLKVAKGVDYKALRSARIKMLLDYIKTKPGFFDWLK